MSGKMDKEISELLLKNAFEEYENARCDEIIEKYKDTEPEYSEEHKRRMEKLFEKEKKSFYWGKFVKRAAMIILAVLLSGTLALQVEAVRIKIENWYYEITGEAIHIGNSVEDLPGYSETDMPIYVLSDEFIEKYGFSVTQEIREKIFRTEYKNISGEYIVMVQHLNKRNTQIDSSEGEVVKQKINGKEIIAVYKEDEMFLYFKEEMEQVCVYSNFEKEKIEEIVSNIVIKI